MASLAANPSWDACAAATRSPWRYRLRIVTGDGQRRPDERDMARYVSEVRVRKAIRQGSVASQRNTGRAAKERRHIESGS